MPRLSTLVRQASALWEPAVERAVFGTDDADELARSIENFVTQRMGPVAGAVFYRPGVGVVAGLRLRDGSGVVVVHRWNVSVDRLVEVQRVQAHLARAGMPAPLPLNEPETLGRGIATIETLLPGEQADGRRPVIRASLASGLHTFMSLAKDLVGQVDVGAPPFLRSPGEPLWFEPHDVRFDFDATAAGAEWIDDLADRARHRLASLDGEAVIGHFDWRVQNLAFAGDDIVAIYDWDSVGLAPEPVVVGVAAAQFTADWSVGDRDPLPTLEDMRAFLGDYEAARGAPFGAEDRETVDAANLFLCAYGARCQHSDATLRPQIAGSPGTGWARLLLERGQRGLIE